MKKLQKYLRFVWTIFFIFIISSSAVAAENTPEPMSFQEQLQWIEQIREIPHLNKLMRENPKFSQFIRRSAPYLTHEKIDGMSKQPEYFEFLANHPKMLDLILASPNPGTKFHEVYFEYQNIIKSEEQIQHDLKLIEEISKLPNMSRLFEQNEMYFNYVRRNIAFIDKEMTVEFVKENADFIEFLVDHPEVLQLIMEHPDPMARLRQAVEEFKPKEENVEKAEDLEKESGQPKER